MMRALVIDDATMFRRAVARMLSRRGFTVQEAADGPGGLAALGDGRFDLVLVDCIMPGMTGPEVISRVRADGSLGLAKVVLVTGLEEQPDGPLGIGADAVLLKPFREAALLSTLDQLGLARQVA